MFDKKKIMYKLTDDAQKIKKDTRELCWDEC